MPPFRAGIFLLIALLFTSRLAAADLKNRSTSSTGQFTIYCDDKNLRSAIVMFAEDTKERILRILKERDDWDLPILITIDRATPGKNKPGVAIALINTVAGPKIEINALLGDDPASIHLQKHLIRALFLEHAYRNRTIENRAPIAEPPWWAVEGIIQTMRRRDGQLTTDIFKQIADHTKLPSLEKLITRPPAQLAATNTEIDRAAALCLIEALLALPDGPKNLARLLREWPLHHQDPVGAITRHFPELAQNESALSKWWALQLARFAHSERWQTLTPAQTHEQLIPLLTIHIPTEKPGITQPYALADFPTYLEKSAALQTLRANQNALITLSSRANPVYRSLIAEYEQIVALLIAKKTKTIPARLATAEKARATILGRSTLITDYLNWYEATQPAARVPVFADYLRATKTPQPAPLDPRITEYLDSLEKEFAPVEVGNKEAAGL